MIRASSPGLAKNCQIYIGTLAVPGAMVLFGAALFPPLRDMILVAFFVNVVEFETWNAGVVAFVGVVAGAAKDVAARSSVKNEVEKNILKIR
jgi:hypothetical protein